MKKKVLVIALCAVFMLFMLVGCGNAGGKGGETTTVPAGQSTEVTKEIQKEEPVSIVMERPLWSNADPTSAPNTRIRSKIKEKTNIDVEVVGQQNPADQAEKPNLMIAAGEKLDIFQTPYDTLRGTDWRKYKNEGTIIPLNDLLDRYGQDLKQSIDPQALSACTDNDGNIWALPDEMNPVTTVLMLRKDWLDKAGLKVPDTFEDFENVLQVFKQKYNDEGFVPFWLGGLNPDAMEGVFEGSFISTGDQRYDDSDGKIKFSFLNPSYKDYLTKMTDWYKKGFLHKEFATMQYQQAADLAFGGRSGLFLNWISGTFNVNIENLKKNVPDGELLIVAPPKGPAGRLISQGLAITSNIMITKSSKNPEAAMKFLNYSMGTDEGWLLTKYGEEGYDWTWKDQAKNILQFTDKQVNTDRYGYAIFASCRLNKFVNKYDVGSTASMDATAFVHDQAKYPTKAPIDLLTVYDTTKMKAKDKISSLDTFIQEAKYKIIMGQDKVSNWDNIIKKWLELGGQQLIDDYTEQYNAQK